MFTISIRMSNSKFFRNLKFFRNVTCMTHPVAPVFIPQALRKCRQGERLSYASLDFHSQGNNHSDLWVSAKLLGMHICCWDLLWTYRLTSGSALWIKPAVSMNNSASKCHRSLLTTTSLHFRSSFIKSDQKRVILHKRGVWEISPDMQWLGETWMLPKKRLNLRSGFELCAAD